MPAIVDHEARRAALARIAADIIAAEGVEAATVRAIARAAGFSTKVVSHYFTDKRALMLATYRFAADHSAALATATQAGGPADVRDHVLSLLPTSPAMLRNWKVWLAFWAYAISDDEFAAEQRRGVLRARREVGETLMADPRCGHLAPAERTAAARDLVTLAIGISLQAAFDPDDWPAERQRRPILERLAKITPVSSARR